MNTIMMIHVGPKQVVSMYVQCAYSQNQNVLLNLSDLVWALSKILMSRPQIMTKWIKHDSHALWLLGAYQSYVPQGL